MGTVNSKPKPLRRTIQDEKSKEISEFAKWEIMVDPFAPVKPELSQLKSCKIAIIEGL